MENRGKTPSFSTRSGAKNQKRPKKPIRANKILEKKGPERATRAKKTFGEICLARALILRRRRQFWFCWHRFGRPGPPGKCLRDRISTDLVFLCAAGAAGREALGTRFWRDLSFTGRRRGRQAVFSGQFLAPLGFNWAPARPAGSF